MTTGSHSFINVSNAGLERDPIPASVAIEKLMASGCDESETISIGNWASEAKKAKLEPPKINGSYEA